MDEPWIYNDGGRAEFGSVAFAGDCVCRAIAIATGEAYGEVYEELRRLGDETPRDGTYDEVAEAYFGRRGWLSRDLESPTPVRLEHLPPGRLVVKLEGHLTAVIDRTIHDTHDPRRHGQLEVTGYFLHPSDARSAGMVREAGTADSSYRKFSDSTTERVKSRIRQLLRVAENDASTEGEIRNAMRFAQNLMQRHSIERDDLGEDDDTSRIRFTRARVFLNGLRRTRWEAGLARFITDHLCPSCNCYTSEAECERRRRIASCVYFYGPEDDVEFCVEMFGEMIVSIAATAKLKGYGGFARGAGALYCQGFVAGMEEAFVQQEQEAMRSPGGREMIELSKRRALAVSDAAYRWLADEEGIRLAAGARLAGGSGSAGAFRSGQRDGRQAPVRTRQKRIEAS